MTPRANAWTLAGSVCSLLVALGAGADYLPDGKLKHTLLAGGGIASVVLALCAHWPVKQPDAVKVPRP